MRVRYVQIEALQHYFSQRWFKEQRDLWQYIDFRMCRWYDIDVVILTSEQFKGGPSNIEEKSRFQTLVF